MEKPMSSSVRVSSFITYGSWRQRAQARRHLNPSDRCATAQRFLQTSTTTHPDLTQLHLDLFRDDVSPVLLSQKVPEYPPQESVDPGLGLYGLLRAPAHLDPPPPKKQDTNKRQEV